MNIFYDDKTDLLYLRLDPRTQEVTNKRVSDELVIDIGDDQKIIGIEILNASKHIDLESILPIKYEPV